MAASLRVSTGFSSGPFSMAAMSSACSAGGRLLAAAQLGDGRGGVAPQLPAVGRRLAGQGLFFQAPGGPGADDEGGLAPGLQARVEVAGLEHLGRQAGIAFDHAPDRGDRDRGERALAQGFQLGCRQERGGGVDTLVGRVQQLRPPIGIVEGLPD